MLKPFTFEHFETFSDIKHGIFPRHGGVSKNKFHSLNLSINSGDEPLKVRNNRKLVSEFLDISPDFLFFPQQCHSSNIKIITQQTKIVSLNNTDALICSQPGIAIGILTADCVPILFYDPVKRLIAAAHAGWRGTVKKIGIHVLEKLRAEFNSVPEEIFIGIGPAISQYNYEVGNEVINEVEKLVPQSYKFLAESKKNKHAYLDLQGLNKYLLEQNGIQKGNIEIMNYCTYNSPEIFYSARRDGLHSGRFGSVICLNK